MKTSFVIVQGWRPLVAICDDCKMHDDSAEFTILCSKRLYVRGIKYTFSRAKQNQSF